MGQSPASTDIDRLKHETFSGRDKDITAFPIALANLVLQGIDLPNLRHSNTLTKQAIYSALYSTGTRTFDLIRTNPPIGGNEAIVAQKNYAYATSSTPILFCRAS